MPSFIYLNKEGHANIYPLQGVLIGGFYNGSHLIVVMSPFISSIILLNYKLN